MSVLDDNIESKVDLQMALEELQKVKDDLIYRIAEREMAFITHTNELVDRIKHLEYETRELRHELDEFKTRYENLTIHKHYKLDGSIEEYILVK